MFALLGGVLDREDGYLAGNVVHGVVDEIGVFARHQLAYAFGGLVRGRPLEKARDTSGFRRLRRGPFSRHVGFAH